MKSTVVTTVLETIAEYRSWRCCIRNHSTERLPPDRPLLGFVPTMGALHEGHMSLVEKALAECHQVVVSIFVNPSQFGPAEDFDKYPRPFEQDLDFCQRAGVHAVFHPTAQEMYPEGHAQSTRVIPPESLADRLCGAFRPGHFSGVATVVSKLFGIVEPHRAYFGEKDYQQLAVIRQMVSDLDLPVTVCGAKTVRESDGLAMSSRNMYLSADERKQAPVLYRTLCFVRDQCRAGVQPLPEILSEARARIAQIPGVTLQYLEACKPETLQSITNASDSMVILVAAKFGSVRLIDNLIVSS